MLAKHLTGKFRIALQESVTRDSARRLEAEIKERNAAIERLEQTIAEQDAQIAALQQSLDQAQFQTGILEQSYGTQLDEARERADRAEQSVTEQREQLEELEADNKVLSRELDGVRARLDSILPQDTATVDELLAGLGSAGGRRPFSDPDDQVEAPADPKSHKEMLPADVMFAARRK